MTWTILIAIVAAIVVAGYIVNTRDVYFGYGQATTLIRVAKCRAIWTGYSLAFINDGDIHDTYLGHLGKSVCNLLLKNGFQVEGATGSKVSFSKD